MVDMAAITGVVTSLKTVADMAKVIQEMKVDEKQRALLIELQNAVVSAQSSTLAAQSELFTLIEQNRALEAKISEFDSWDMEAARYALVDFGDGTFAHQLKEEAANGEPEHLLCPNCFSSKQKKILQFQHRTSDKRRQFHCNHCKSDFFLGKRQPISGSRLSGRYTMY
ncbi:hypothetical protein AAFN47_01940 [Hoeflea sp. CAU 1731]